jgi:hypothetical protein
MKGLVPSRRVSTEINRSLMAGKCKPRLDGILVRRSRYRSLDQRKVQSIRGDQPGDSEKGFGSGFAERSL